MTGGEVGLVGQSQTSRTGHLLRGTRSNPDNNPQELFPLRTTESLTRVSQCIVQSLQRFRLDLTNSLASKP